MSVLAAPLASPFYEGAGITVEVPSRFDCAINGTAYMYDTRFMGNGQFRRSSVPLLKPQQDNSGEISERSLNPEDLIRQAQESWHRGAGQEFLDRATSDPYRFRSSKGLDPWDEWKLSLLNDTTLSESSSDSNCRAVVAGDRLYFVQGQTMAWTTDLSSWTSVTDLPAADISSIATDGYNIWVTCGASGLYETNTGTNAASQLVSSALATDAVVGFAKGRLMVGSANKVYNITSATVAALPTELLEHRSDAFRFAGFASGPSAIYMAGYSGDKSEVYLTVMKADGSGLEIPVHCSPGLPDGEIVRSIYAYLNVVTLGTDYGVRFCAIDDTGDLNVGELIDIGSSVRCFEGQGRFIWFGWSDFDGTSTGLGRLDPTQADAGGVLAPAYASDLMAATQGAVLSAGSFLDGRFFTVSGEGLYTETDTPVSSGWVRSGQITHGLPDDKIALYLGLSHEPIVGSISVELAPNGGDFTSIGSSAMPGDTARILNAGEVRAESFELLLTFAPSGTSPVLTRWTLESNPAPGRGEVFVVYLRLYDTVTDRNGTQIPNFNPKAKYEALVALEQAGRPIAYQDAGGTYTVLLDDHDFFIDKSTATFFDGTFAAKFRRPRRRVS